ncbi:hypothetical protein B1790_31485 [Mycobacterium sp. AT1]|nr:hypothetical protein B1790_31485 [Mycobacterium sp. AT1]
MTPTPDATRGGVVIGDDGLARPPWAAANDLLRRYYDTEWGVLVRDERGVFERNSLEAFQRGCRGRRSSPSGRRSAKRSIDSIPTSSPATDRRRWRDCSTTFASCATAARSRRRSATRAATIDLRRDGGLAELVWAHQPEESPAPRVVTGIPTMTEDSERLARALSKRGFSFVGPTTMFALMEAIGVVDTHLLDTHRRGCSGLWTVDGRRRARPPKVGIAMVASRLGGR